MIIENKKTIITVLVSFVLWALIWALISPAKVTNAPIPQQIDQAAIQARIEAQRRVAAAVSGNTQRPENIQKPNMPWDVAVNMIEKAPIEKIQVLTGLSVKLYMKGGATFVTDQPTKDAYLDAVKKSKLQIQIIK